MKSSGPLFVFQFRILCEIYYLIMIIIKIIFNTIESFMNKKIEITKIIYIRPYFEIFSFNDSSLTKT